MRSLIELQQYRKCIVFFMVGVVCSSLAFIIYAINPVNMVLQSTLNMSPTSMIFKVWRKPEIAVFLNVYVFNISNAEAFLNGDEKILEVEEIGPFVYQETLENTNITWNDNGTITYIPRRSLTFIPSMSVGDPKDDYVLVPNIPMLGIFSALSDSGFFVNYPFVQLTNFLDSKTVLNITIHDYLWGYEDSLISLAGTVVPSYIDFKKFGLLDRMYDEGENFINMNIKHNADVAEEDGRYLSIETINGSPGLSKWGYVDVEGNETTTENTRCNTVRGTTEGTVFPSNPNERTMFRVYRKAFCHPIPIVFEKRLEMHGLSAVQFTFPENFADPPELNPDNECLCRNKPCLKKGLLDVTPCYYNIPAAASKPHFLDTDPTLSNGIRGLKPDPEKHNTKIVLQKTTGIPMHVRSKMQINLVMSETRYNSKTAPFNGLTVPLFWTDLEIVSLPDHLMFLVRLATVIAPIGQLVFVILLGIGGLLLICWSLVRALLIIQEEQQRQEAEDRERRDSTDLRAPLDYGQYTAIRILPAIKKITSKSDLFI